MGTVGKIIMRLIPEIEPLVTSIKTEVDLIEHPQGGTVSDKVQNDLAELIEIIKVIAKIV